MHLPQLLLLLESSLLIYFILFLFISLFVCGKIARKHFNKNSMVSLWDQQWDIN